MKIHTLIVGSLGTNCYLVESGEEVGIIDPGDDADFIIRKIQDLGSIPVWVACTHGHFDHILAVSELSLAFGIPFYLNSKDKFLLDRAKETSEYFLGVSADPILVAPENLKEGMKLEVGEESLEVIETPGHTPGGVSFYLKEDKALFCGDLVFAHGGVGRTDFQYASEKELEDSIKKVLKMAEDIMVYPGHGDEVEIKELRKDLKKVMA